MTASLDGQVLTQVQDNSSGYGMAAVGSGWHVAYFQNFTIANNTA